MNDELDTMQSLKDRERMRGETRMFLEGTIAGDVTEELARQVVHHLDTYCKEHKITNSDIARDLDCSPGVISEVKKLKYAGDWRTKIIQIDAWLDNARNSRKIPGREPEFVETEVSREIYTIARLVIATRKIGLVYGPDSSGIGKTMTMRAIHREMPGSILITCDKIEANPTGVLRAMATELRITPAQSNRTLYARIKETLLGTSRLILIDQIHNLRNRSRVRDDKAFFILTDLWDATGAPQLWCGTADLYAYFLQGRSRDESLAQIRRRIAFYRDLLQRTQPDGRGGKGEPLFSLESIRRAFGSNKIRLTDTGETFLMRLANIPDSGGLGTCANLLLVATIVAEEQSRDAIDAVFLAGCYRDTQKCDVFADAMKYIRLDELREKKRVAAAG